MVTANRKAVPFYSPLRFVGRIMRQQIVLFLLGIAAPSVAFGDQLTWTLKGTFNDGGSASGFFVFNPDTNTLTNWGISTTGGNTSVFFPFAFTPVDSSAGFFTSAGGALEFASNQVFANPNPLLLPEQLVFSFVPVAPLTDAGGTVSINVNDVFSDECFNCNPFRTFTSGSVTATPEPGSLPLLVTGLLGIVGAVRRKRLG